MATVIHEHEKSPEVVHEHHDVQDSGAIGSTMALIIGILVVLLLLFYGIPYLRGGGGTNVNVPDTIDVNVNPGGAAQ